MKILVTGGAGYIGSVTVRALQSRGYDVVVFDNLSQGHKESISSVPLIVGDLTKKEDFAQLDAHTFDAVIHFAASALAGESMQDPYKYFHNNILGGLNLVDYMREKKIPHIIFSSTCAIYGHPEKIPVSEDESKKPESVYGESKLTFEKILHWYDEIFQIKHVNLRYFNAAGASIDGLLGEQHDPETHIIPVAIRKILTSEHFTLFGTDYPTSDGTCVRDYIHVEDLAIAHIQALEYLKNAQTSNYFNLGTGKGYSNREVLDMIQKVTGKSLVIEEKPRRAGDPPIIFADNAKAKNELGFDPQYSDLQTIIETAWKWHSTQK